MGVNVANMEPVGHGQPGVHYGLRVRLHFGVHSIDETLDMTDAVWLSLLREWYDDDEAGFLAKVKTWVDANASASARAYKADFADAMWSYMPDRADLPA